MSRTSRILAAAALTVAAAGTARADGWQHAITPYIWGTGMSGVSAVGTPLGPLEADVDLSFGDILDNLQFGAMVAYRGDRGPWTVMTDAIYMDLEADKRAAAGPLTVDATVGVEQIALEALVGYRWIENVTAFAGLRYNDVDADLAVVRSGPGTGTTRRASKGDSWVDPFVGALAEIPLAERWLLELRGDIGGFGVGSDFAWQTKIAVRWRASSTIDVVGSWRYMDMDYEDGSGTDYFKYDIATSGPGIGVTFRF